MLAGVVAGIAGAMASERLIASLVEGAEPRGLLSIAVATPILVVAGLFASLIPARRAGRADPAALLK
jgi:hypothetical protein